MTEEQIKLQNKLKELLVTSKLVVTDKRQFGKSTIINKMIDLNDIDFIIVSNNQVADNFNRTFKTDKYKSIGLINMPLKYKGNFMFDDILLSDALNLLKSGFLNVDNFKGGVVYSDIPLEIIKIL